MSGLEYHEVRAGIRAKNEKLIKKFKTENQKLHKEFSDKIESERTRFTNVVNKVQRETGQELVAVKQRFKEFGPVFEPRLEQNVKDTTAVTDEIVSKITEVRSELNNKVEKLTDSVDEVNGKVIN
jgi:exonuclease VII large subunit